MQTRVTRRPQVTSNRGEFALFILASSARKYDGQELKETLWIARRPCPVFVPQTIDASLAADPIVSLDPGQRAKVVPICRAALNRLKSEGRAPDPYSISAADGFKFVNYGYYFVAYLEQTILPLAPDGGYANYDPATYRKPTYTNVSLCPQITSLAGCEVIWQPLLAPFLAKQDRSKELAEKELAEYESDRVRRVAPLEAAQREQLAAIVRRYTAAARPMPVTTGLPQPATRPRSRKGGHK